MAPFSDLDLMLWFPGEAHPGVNSVEAPLYILWDLSSRSANRSARLAVIAAAKEDITIRTADRGALGRQGPQR